MDPIDRDAHPQSHPDPNIAYHFDWEFRREAIRWVGERAIGINFHPLAKEFRHWLLREGQFPILAEQDKHSFASLTNPYSYHASVLAAILARVINASHEFATGTGPIDEMEGGIERIRLYNEQILYMARFCEAAIKHFSTAPRFRESSTEQPRWEPSCLLTAVYAERQESHGIESPCSAHWRIVIVFVWNSSIAYSST